MSREKITVEWLEDVEACEGEVEAFKGVFPKGCFLTRANLIKAADANLNIGWVLRRMFTRTGIDKWNQSNVHKWDDATEEKRNMMDAEDFWRFRHDIRAEYREKFGIK